MGAEKYKNSMKKTIVSLSYLIVWIVIDHIIVVMNSDSPSRKAYGLLSAWWAALYLCNLAGITRRYILCLIPFGFCYSLYSNLYSSHRTITELDLDYILSPLIIFMSPLFVNMFIEVIKKTMTKKFSCKRDVITAAK